MHATLEAVAQSAGSDRAEMPQHFTMNFNERHSSGEAAYVAERESRKTTTKDEQ